MSLPTILVVWMAALALGGATVLASLFQLLGGAQVSTQDYLLQVKKLLSANHRERAIRLATAHHGAAALRLMLFALQLRVPILDPVAKLGGYYRSTPVEWPFEERVREALETERSALLRPLERWWLAALVAGCALTLVAVPAAALAPESWQLVAVATGVVDLLTAVVTWRVRRVSQDLALVVETMAPHVLPETQDGAMMN